MQRLFRLDEHGTTVKRECLAGLTTFVTIAYLQIVAPGLLHQMGMPYELAFFAVVAVVLFGCTLSAVLSNLPFAFAPGLGLLTYASYVVVQQLHYSWQATLGVVTLTGFVFFLLTVFGLRRIIMDAIPKSMGYAIAAGIGFFIGFIALRNMHVVVSSPYSLVTLGHMDRLDVVLFILGFVLIGALEHWHVPGAILISMVAVTLISALCGGVTLTHIFAWPAVPHHLWGHLQFEPWFHISALSVVFTFILVALFDSTGTIIGLSKLLSTDPAPQLSGRLQRALVAESFTTGMSGLLGATTASPLVESSSGIRAGGQTGLTAIVVAILFSLLLLFAPLAQSIPVSATSAALFYIAFVMAQPLSNIDWQDKTEFIPAMITLLMIPLTFSIADGVGVGLICYALMKLMSGRWRECHPFIWVLFVGFVVYFGVVQ